MKNLLALILSKDDIYNNPLLPMKDAISFATVKADFGLNDQDNVLQYLYLWFTFLDAKGCFD